MLKQQCRMHSIDQEMAKVEDRVINLTGQYFLQLDFHILSGQYHEQPKSNV